MCEQENNEWRESLDKEDELLDDHLRIRINATELDIFQKKSARMGSPYQMLLREMITAYNDGRLRIKPTDEQKKSLGELYS